MKKIWWILIILGSLIFPLLFMILVPIVIMELSWWWFTGTLIAESIISGFGGLIYMIIKIRKREEIKLNIDVATAKEIAINEFKYDNDNPDNFKINKSVLNRVGEKGAGEKTPVLFLKGVGTENNDNRVAIINLNKPKEEMSRMINPTEEEIEEAIRLIAENPQEEIKEERTMSTDQFGRPVSRLITRRPSQIEKEIEKEKKEAEELQAI